jgi:hypothetical protein
MLRIMALAEAASTALLRSVMKDPLTSLATSKSMDEDVQGV